MNITVYLPFCKNDAPAALRLIEWIKELGGCSDNDIVLITPANVLSAKVYAVADTCFRNVSTANTPFDLGDESHPRGPNWMFETACKHAMRTLPTDGRWLWMEPDCVPMRKGWLQEIENEHKLPKILAHVTKLNDPKWPKQIASGTAVYPAEAWKIYRTLAFDRKTAWDIKFADSVMPMVTPSKTIFNRFNRQSAPTFEGEGPSRMKLEDIHKEVALFHPNKDGTLIAALRKATEKTKPKAKIKSKQIFSHGGDLGDIVYSLPIVKNLGGGEIHFNSVAGTREKMTPERVKFISPLLMHQKYITKVTMLSSDKVDFDLNAFRPFKDQHYDKVLSWGVSLPEWSCRAFNMPTSILCQPWLTCEKHCVEKVVIHRSARYHNIHFDWKRVLQKYGNMAVFIGQRDEYEAFKRDFGAAIQFYAVKDALEMAEIINGAELFIGNQSFPNSVAEGLKKPKITETWMTEPDCCFERLDCQNVFSKNMFLPDL